MNSAKSDKRQKIVLVLLIIVGVILVWQLYGLFGGGSHSAPSKSAVTAIPPARPPMPVKPANLTVTPATTAAQLAQTAPSAVDGRSPADTSTAINPTDNQSQYLRLVSEYQMAQLQRMIAEDNEAIAVARQNAAKAMTETAKLMGTGTVTMSNDSSQSNNKGYQLVYTGQQGDGAWTATLKRGGQDYNVLVDGQLPDGSQVMSIDDNGVLLQRGNKKELVTFSGITQVIAKSSAAGTATQPGVNSTHGAENSINKPTVAETANKSEAALTATPDKPAAPEKNTQIAAIKPPLVQSTKELIAVKPLADKSEAALTATPDNPTMPAKQARIAEATKAPAKSQPVQSKNVPVKSSVPVAPMQTIAPVTIEAHTTPAPTEAIALAKADHPLSPLEQPMVKFPTLPAQQTQTVKPADAVVTTTGVANQQLMNIDPSNYTIQLTSDHEIASLEGFIDQHKLRGKAVYFRTTDMQSRPLYILIYGQFPTAEAATKALDALSAGTKKEGAFIVKFATIQAVLKKQAATDNAK